MSTNQPFGMTQNLDENEFASICIFQLVFDFHSECTIWLLQRVSDVRIFPEQGLYLIDCAFSLFELAST